MTVATDRIVKSIVLHAPLERVWRAIGDAQQFGRWFGMQFDGQFAAGAHLTGRIVPTTVDAEIAKTQAPHAGTRFDVWIERVEAPRRLSFRWHPYAVDPAADYAAEPTTLVEFELADAGAGTRVTITESGFDAIPLARRAEAFSRNSEGWAMQTALLEKYVAADLVAREQRIFEVIYIRSTPEAVWRALTDADLTERYWFQTRIVSDWRVGATVRYLRNGELTDEHVVLAVEPPRMLSHTFHPVLGDYQREPPSRVEFRVDGDNGVVRLTVQHEGFPSDSKVFRACSEGWPMILSNLKTLLESGQPLPDFEFEPQPARFA
jgi:uncharacterized protein YndB with AHSA1/START domain